MHLKPVYAWALIATCIVAVMALAVNVQLAFFIALFAVVAWWSWYNPTVATSLLIVVAPLLPMFKITQTAGNITLIKDVIILTLFGRLVVIPFLQKKLPYRRNILLLPLLFLGGWVVVTNLSADSLIVGVLRARDIVLYALLYPAVLYLPQSRAWYRTMCMWFMASVAVVTVLGFYQFFALPDSTVLRFDPARQIWIPRVSSIMAHPSILGQYLITASTLLAALVLVHKNPRHKLAALAGGAVLLVLIYLTYSRAVWLGYAAGLVAIALLWMWSLFRKTTRLTIPWRSIGVGIGIFILLAAVAIQFSSLSVFLRSAFDPTYASNAERLEFMARLVSPLTPIQALLGAGLGDVAAQQFRMPEINTFDITSGAARTVQLAKDATLVDNQHLKTFIEMGLAGLLIYAFIYWRVARNSWLLTTHHSLPTQRIIGLWAIGFLTAFIIQGFFIDIWDIFPTNMAFWFLAALVSRELTKNPA